MKIVELKKMPKTKIGRVNTDSVHLEAHEYDTIYFLASFGLDIEVIRPTNTPGVHNPDFLIRGTIWEAKSPEGSSKNTIQRKIHEAGHQSDRLILDLRRVKLPAKFAEEDAIKRFRYSKRIKRMLLITKSQQLLDIKK